jgi:hypothetical protein
MSSRATSSAMEYIVSSLHALMRAWKIHCWRQERIRRMTLRNLEERIAELEIERDVRTRNNIPTYDLDHQLLALKRGRAFA